MPGDDGGGHAHAHGANLNMVAVLLHTLGDVVTAIAVRSQTQPTIQQLDPQPQPDPGLSVPSRDRIRNESAAFCALFWVSDKPEVWN